MERLVPFGENISKGRINTYKTNNKFFFESLEALLKYYKTEEKRADIDNLIIKYLEQLKELKGENNQQLAYAKKLVAQMFIRVEQKIHERDSAYPDDHAADGSSILDEYLKDKAWKED